MTKLSDLDIEMDGNNVSLNLMQERVKIEELAGVFQLLRHRILDPKNFVMIMNIAAYLLLLAPPPELSLAADTFLASQWHPEKMH